MPGFSSASKYDTKVTVERLIASPTLDALNDQVLDVPANWETYHEPYAAILARGGRQFERYGIINAEVSHVLEVRKGTETAAITQTDRITLGARSFQIKAVYVPSGGSRYVLIEATEIK